VDLGDNKVEIVAFPIPDWAQRSVFKPYDTNNLVIGDWVMLRQLGSTPIKVVRVEDTVTHFEVDYVVTVVWELTTMVWTHDQCGNYYYVPWKWTYYGNFRYHYSVPKFGIHFYITIGTHRVPAPPPDVLDIPDDEPVDTPLKLPDSPVQLPEAESHWKWIIVHGFYYSGRKSNSACVSNYLGTYYKTMWNKIRTLHSSGCIRGIEGGPDGMSDEVIRQSSGTTCNAGGWATSGSTSYHRVSWRIEINIDEQSCASPWSVPVYTG
jgi:hypothetical protein